MYNLGTQTYLNAVFQSRVPGFLGYVEYLEIIHSFQKRRFIYVLPHSSFCKGFCGPLGGFVLANWKRLENNVLKLEVHHSSAELFGLEQT